MNNLSGQLEEIKKFIPESKTQVAEISKANISWHLHHTLLVINSVVNSLQESEPGNYKPAFSIRKYAVLWGKKIPRGKARAPKSITPTIELDENGLSELLEEATQNVQKLSTLKKDKHFPHPFFGSLTLKQAIPFLQTHTEHHLKIVRDILQATNDFVLG